MRNTNDIIPVLILLVYPSYFKVQIIGADNPFKL